MRARADRRIAAVGKGPNDNEGALAPRRQPPSVARCLAAACEPRRGAKTMASRTWVLHVELVADADCVAADLDMEAIIGEGIGAPPLRAVADLVDSWTRAELDARTTIARVQ